MAIGVSGTPIWHDTNHEGLTHPVMELPQIVVDHYESMETWPPNYIAQEWVVRPPLVGTPSYGQDYFLLCGWGISRLPDQQWPMNVPDHLLGGDNLKIAIQVSPDNGGLDNELWAIANTASQPPSISLAGTTNLPGGGFSLNVTGSRFEPGATITVYTIPNPAPVALTIPSTVTVDNHGNFEARLNDILFVGGPSSALPPLPAAGKLALVAVDEFGYALAFTTIDISYFLGPLPD